MPAWSSGASVVAGDADGTLRASSDWARDLGESPSPRRDLAGSDTARGSLSAGGTPARSPEVGERSGVPLAEAVEVLEGPGLGHPRDRPPDLKRARAVGRGRSTTGHLRVGTHVGLLAEASHGVHPRQCSVVVAPHHGGLRRSSGMTVVKAARGGASAKSTNSPGTSGRARRPTNRPDSTTAPPPARCQPQSPPSRCWLASTERPHPNHCLRWCGETNRATVAATRAEWCRRRYGWSRPASSLRPPLASVGSGLSRSARRSRFATRRRSRCTPARASAASSPGAPASRPPR
jgi:hypothetical protein